MRVPRPCLVAAVLLVVSAALLAGCASSSGRVRTNTAAAAARPAASTLPASRRHGAGGYRFSIAHGARIRPDRVSGSFYAFSATPRRPHVLIVALHGHNATAWQAYRRWQPYAARHGLGLVSVEWQVKWGSDAQFLDTADTYALIRRAVREEGTAPGQVLLHGFSMGSHEAFAVTALDNAGPRLFAMTLAESGGAGFGIRRDRALRGSRWVLYCAGRDPWPNLSGCPAMRRARGFLRSSGAIVQRFIFDPQAGHGGLLLNGRDVELALADFARARAGR